MEEHKLVGLIERLNNALILPEKIGLLGGKMGLIIYGAMASQLNISNNLWESHLDELFDTVNHENFNFSSYNYSTGLAGFCLGMSHLHDQQLVDFDPLENLSEYDEMLYKIASQVLEEKRVDFLHEGLGIIHYFNKRLPNSQIKDYLSDLLVLFLRNASTEQNAFYYKSTVGGFAGEGIDFGLAHGLCGQLLILCNACENGILIEGLKESIQSGTNFILKQKSELSKDQSSYYPSGLTLPDKKKIFYDRNAWCYGDINQAMLFYKAYNILNDKKYLDAADFIGDAICQRQTPQSNLLEGNAHFCHGSSGLAQCYYSLHRLTQQKRYMDMYYHWINYTIQDLSHDLDKHTLKGKEHELLDGLTGAGLVLTSYILDDDRSWDQLFLLQ